MRLTLALPPLLAACLGIPVFAAGEFRLTGRAGLYDTPGYTAGEDRLFGLTESGWISGYSRIDGAAAAWITDSPDGVSRRVGLFTGTGFEGNAPPAIISVTESGFVRGTSVFKVSEAVSYPIPWVANGVTGVTTLAGLPGPAFAAPDGHPDTELTHLTAGGYAWGISRGYNGLPADPLAGPPVEAVWLLNAHTGVVSRQGLLEGVPHTRVGDSQQRSWGYRLTESGLLTGGSLLFYSGTDETGAAMWVTEAGTGVTRRIGLFSGSEFTGHHGLQKSYGDTAQVKESGLVSGRSALYAADGSELGTAAWVADAATGVTRRIGLYEGAEYTKSDNGARDSAPWIITENGRVAGDSAVYVDGALASRAAWVADARGGAARRVGVFAEGGPYTGSGVTSRVGHLKESGWTGGYNVRPMGNIGESWAAWVTHADTGVTHRVGLTGPGFVSSVGERSEVEGMTESGWAWGFSDNFGEAPSSMGSGTSSQAVWVANAATGVTRRVGLEGAEFKHSTRATYPTIHQVTESGRVYGDNIRWRGAERAGYAVWTADAATGVVTRLGLTGAEFTNPAGNFQVSGFSGWTQSGLVRGVSISYLTTPHKLVPWVTDTVTGQTWRMDDVITALTEEGLVTGHTLLPLTTRPRVAWLADLRSGLRVSFQLSAPAPGGQPHSEIRGITADRTAYGVYTLFKNGADLGLRAFLWSEGLGTLLLDNPGPGPAETAGYEYLSSLSLNSRGFAAGEGKLPGVAGTGVFFGAARAAASVPGARVTDLVRLPDGKHRLSFHTDAAVGITLQSSNDLSIWKDEQTVNASAGASSMDIDADPAAPTQKYWRLKTGPVSP